MDEVNEHKIQTKIDEMKLKRGGKAHKLDVVVSDSPNLNFQHAVNEMFELCELHKMMPDEVYMLAAHLQCRARNVAVAQKTTRVKLEWEAKYDKLTEKYDKSVAMEDDNKPGSV